MSFTRAQQEAIAARGNVLVVAGAGTGKTRTLVERCLDCLLNERPPASIDEILMVTFTEAAAAEMRQRIRVRLEQEGQSRHDVTRWQEELALFETAHFGTLHSFCFQLVRQHFYQLELDPQLTVLAEPEARLLAEETLEVIFQAHYAGREPANEAVRRLIQTQGRGWDRTIRAHILRLHHYAQTLPSPAGWLKNQSDFFAQNEPLTWRRWWVEAVSELPPNWLPRLRLQAGQNEVAARCAAALEKVSAGSPPELFADLFRQVALARSNCLRGKKGLWVKPLEPFFAETDFLSSLICVPGQPDPLAQDWGWVREQMSTLLGLCQEFAQAFAEAKRELGVLDFHDLEQYSLQLLWDPATNQPTRIARHWRQQFRFIFVDEYQDINAAQDQIIQALAREGSQANRFLVGDVKQSIYRFRLANPQIFHSYSQEWARGPSRVLPLVDNFRSRERLLDFVNSLFGLLIRRELGGADYATEAALRFGAPQERTALSTASDATPAAELHLLLKEGAESVPDNDEPSEALAEILELQEADKEARLVGLRLKELREQQLPIWDVEASQFRPVEWRDMAVLLRSPARKSESYAKEFARLDLPLQVARAGFYQSLEVSDLLSLLQVLDNPLQDLPLLAVLHSPLVGLTANELAEIRLATVKTRFWTALTCWHRNAEADSRKGQKRPETDSGFNSMPGEVARSETRQRVGVFLERFARWRRLARHGSLCKCLEAVLSETHYRSWVLTQSRGAQRQANVQRMLILAQDFDRFQRQGLFRFLRFIEAQKAVETEPEVAASTSENAVRLMSIHQSKGLEFPVVVVADLSKPFNLIDLRAEIILDEQFGLCPRVKPPHTGKRYPSLSYWLARRRQLRELLGEELRLLYVAMTRARDRLLVTGRVGQRKFDSDWRQPRQANLEVLLGARCYSDWLGLWFSLHAASSAKDEMTGETALLRWFIREPADLLGPELQKSTADPGDVEVIDFTSEDWRRVQQRLAWEYPFLSATRFPAKTSVTVLRRQAAANEDEATSFRPGKSQLKFPTQPGISPASKLSAAEIGNAHHEFLQLFSLDQADGAAALADEARRLQEQARLSPEQVAALDFDCLAHFWMSELGRRIRARRELVQRELAFTARFASEELPGMLAPGEEKGIGGEFVLVQGIADLVVLAPEEIWLVDFKTDQFELKELPERVRMYAPQLKLYASALSRIYRRPVTEAWLYFLSLREPVAIHAEVGV